ncbi:hypothetical protein V1264_004386 [Littorina saxatilis]|uniref:LicD/FKTN/FKRP nucleotidyltransferase domain-containing protein n=1 Tax=Littorina saxatilis TaxID=31220 RepID=A0AAN9G857_9CAEN
MILVASLLSAPKTAGHWLASLGHRKGVQRLRSSLPYPCFRWKRPLLACFLLVILLVVVKIMRRPRCAREPTQFQPALTVQQRELLLDALDEFQTTLRKAQIPFFMYDGTLLGSWRHHGLIPWDEDIDVAVPFVDKDRLRVVLEQLKPGYILHADELRRWKFYSSLAAPVGGKTWSAPFIDISFYNRTGTHVVVADPPGDGIVVVWPQGHVFPLTFRPFEGRQLLAPRNTYAALKMMVEIDLCRVEAYSHLKVRYVRKCSDVLCADIQHRFPFVVRMFVGEGVCEGCEGVCEESLVLNRAVISQVVLNYSDGCGGYGQKYIKKLLSSLL